MANGRKFKISKRELKVKLLLTFVVAVLLAVSLLFSTQIEGWLNIGKSESSGKYVDSKVLATYDMRLHYLDVGQADSTFVELPGGKTLLIDAGTRSAGSDVVEYVSALGYSQITYFVLTHCDEDHVGGAVAVFEAFEIVNIYRPFQVAGKYMVGGEAKTSGKAEEFVCDENEDLTQAYEYLKAQGKTSTISRVTSNTYKNTVAAIYAETYTSTDGSTAYSNVSVNYDGIVLEDSSAGYKAEFMAPLVTSDNYDLTSIAPHGRTTGKVTKTYNATSAMGKNAISPLILLEYKQQSFVFTGDMTKEAESDLLAAGGLSATDRARLTNVTVYQAGHHGAKESNSQEFLELLNPKFTVVSSNPKGNDYGHPHQEFLDRLASLHPTNTDYLLRTDTVGNIMFGVNSSGDVGYHCGIEVNNPIFEVAWWQIAVGIFVVFLVLMWAIRVPKQKSNRRYASTSSARKR